LSFQFSEVQFSGGEVLRDYGVMKVETLCD